MKIKLTFKQGPRVVHEITGSLNIQPNEADPVHKQQLARTIHEVEEGVEKLTGYRCHVEEV